MADLTPLAIRDRELYGRGLAEIRHHRRVAFWLSVAFLPGGVALGIIANLITRSQLAAVIVAGAWMGVMVVSSVRVGNAPCPRCGDRFHVGRWWSNPWATRCLSCGLHLRADEGAV